MSSPSDLGRVLLVGAGGHASSCIDVIEQSGWSIAGLVGQPDEVGAQVLDFKVLGSDQDLPELARTIPWALVSVGQIHSPALRIRLYLQILRAGFNAPVILSPNAYVSPHAHIGAGTIVMHGAIINAGAHIGENCIINSRALIEHGARVGDHCHIATAAVLNGDVQVGDGGFIGSSAVIREGVVLAGQCVVGMGVRVRYDQTEGSRVVNEN